MKKVLRKLTRSGEFFIMLFIIPTIAFFIELEWTLINVLFVIATELILAHTTYVGYIVLKHQEKTNLIQYSLLGSIWFGMLILFSDWGNLTNWFLGMISVFLIALTFHWYTRDISDQKNIKEFCEKKFYLDTIGIVLGVCGVIFVKLFQRNILLALLNISTIILMNYLIFFKLRLFDKFKSR